MEFFKKLNRAYTANISAVPSTVNCGVTFPTLHCEKNNPKVVIPAKDYGMSVEKLDRNWTN